MIEDLKHRLAFVLSERRDATVLEKAKLIATMANRGTARSSAAIQLKRNIAFQQLDAGILDLVTDVEKAKLAGVPDAELRTALDASVLELVGMLTGQFEEPASDAFGPGYGMAPEMLRELDDRAWSLVRQYWAGYLSRSAPHGSYFSLTVNGSPGAAIQQGNSGSIQNVVVTINHAAAREAAEVLSGELSKAAADTPGLADAQADLEAIKHQIGREKPSPGLLNELGKSLRSVLEGGLGGVLSSGGLVAAQQLWTALGIG